jgi:hypothetical protein
VLIFHARLSQAAGMLLQFQMPSKNSTTPVSRQYSAPTITRPSV